MIIDGATVKISDPLWQRALGYSRGVCAAATAFDSTRAWLMSDSEWRLFKGWKEGKTDAQVSVYIKERAISVPVKHYEYILTI